MRRKKFGRKLLSSLLAFSLCLTSAASLDVARVEAAETTGAPEVVSEVGNTWNGVDPARMYVKAAEGTAVDSADLKIT